MNPDAPIAHQGSFATYFFTVSEVVIHGVQLRPCIRQVYGRSEKPARLPKCLPHGREGEGLHLSSVREALNRGATRSSTRHRGRSTHGRVFPTFACAFDCLSA
jgi:hypothetical protein